jgi:hypothetical protein
MIMLSPDSVVLCTDMLSFMMMLSFFSLYEMR